MHFTYRRRYRGGLQAVILDWAGTTLDFGCMAPAVVFMQVYKTEGVPITIEEARAPMGAHKRVHIQRISEEPPVLKRWREVHGRWPDESDIDRMFAQFVPLQLGCLGDYSELIPGALEVVTEIRRRSIKIGSTTGYTRAMTDLLMAEARRQGYEPDASVCADEVPEGRPAPFMCLKNAIELGVWPVEACVKVDDTLPGIEEGLNAGMWTVGLAASGNEVGVSLAEFNALESDDRERRVTAARQRMYQTGAHYVVDTIADLIPCLDAIEEQLRRGERP